MQLYALYTFAAASPLGIVFLAFLIFIKKVLSLFMWKLEEGGQWTVLLCCVFLILGLGWERLDLIWDSIFFFIVLCSVASFDVG